MVLDIGAHDVHRTLVQQDNERMVGRVLRKLTSHRPINQMNVKKFIWYCRLYGCSNAIRLALRKLRKPDPLHLNISPLSLPDSIVSSHEEDLPSCVSDSCHEYQK